MTISRSLATFTLLSFTATLTPALNACSRAAAPATPPGQHATVRRASVTTGSTQWREPNGRYTLAIPAGWHIDTAAGNLKITNGDSWAIFETTYNPGSPLDVAKKTASQMQPLVDNWRVFNQGAFTTPSQHASAGVTVGCIVATRTGPSDRVMLFASQAAGGGNFITMTASAAQPSAQPTNAALMKVFESIHFAGE